MYDTDALAPRATIPQRLDRLPLTWPLWRLALVTQAGWALVVATFTRRQFRNTYSWISARIQ